ncbi:zinc finger MIZ domain-containing protein 2 [Podospora fimiseda]|uniref:Zinc finger MIZ domain-containing protein 2 n=1 Tax=Podospora fimiseda TaxID=252190 RepID=A0AAN7BJG8_9PEZI|nr:zinc finger MIZ domain-containing protein 2 [Podospora fimiseda]
MPASTNPTAAPNKGHHPAGSSAADTRQIGIADTNATVSTFLRGGSRMPSWLIDSQPSSGSNPISKRKPKPPLRPLLGFHHDRPPTVVLPSPAPSDEPSPEISNLLDSPDIPPGPLPAFANQVDQVLNTVSDSAHHSTTLLPDAPTMGPTTSLASNSLHVTDARFVHVNEPPIHNPNNIDPRGLATEAGENHSVPEHSTDQALATSNPGHNGQVLVGPTSEAAPSQLIPLVQAHIQKTGGDGALNLEVDKPRMQLLMTACEQEDSFFVTLHQLFTMWSDEPRQVYGILQMPEDIAEAGFQTLEQILKKNQHVSTAHRYFFANFPGSWSNPRYIRTNKHRPARVAKFLDKLVTEYDTLTRETWSRRYPYLVDEMVNRLGCQSPVLQHIFFTANRRRLGVMDGIHGSQMEQIFRSEQVVCIGNNISAAEKEKQIRAVIGAYKAILPTVGVVHPRHQMSSPTSPQQQNHFVPILPSLSYADITTGQLDMRYQQPQSPNTVGYPMVSPTVGNMPGQFYPVTPQYRQHQQPQFEQGLQGESPSPVLQQPQQFHHPAQQQSPILQQQQQHQQQFYQAQMAQRAHLLAMQQQQQQQQQQAQAGMLPPQHQRRPSLQQQAQQQQPISFQRRINIDHQQSGNQMARLRPQAQNLGIITSAIRPAQRDSTQLQQVPPFQGPIIPPRNVVITRPEFPYDPTDKKALMNGLHQSHIRSPKRVLRNGGTERVYQAVKSFPVPPTRLPERDARQYFHFEVTEEQLALVGKAAHPRGSLLPVVEHFHGMLRWRVRCCTPKGKTRSSAEPPTEQEWVTLDVTWPEHIFIRLNDKDLECRKEPHNGKDLPVELTDHLKLGTNVLQVVSPIKDKVPVVTRFIAVELLESVNHSFIVHNVWESGIIPADVTLEIIKKRLTPAEDDDAVIIEAPHLAIDLACPFSSVIFEVPARGVGCTHLECFDLETWLNTRPPSKPKTQCHHTQVQCDCLNTPEPSSADKWRCPICHGDARPFSLRIDGFLLKVRSQLKDDGQLNTKRLLVEADGKWSVVMEEDDDPGSDQDIPPLTRTGSSLLKRKVPEHEVIELLD